MPGRQPGRGGAPATSSTSARRKGSGAGARAALAIVSMLVLTVTGYAWAAMEGLVNGLTTTDVISNADRPADGARDILLVGMDSRVDAQGNPLPQDMLAKLNAGAADGELNTDTLILLHVPNDGKKAVALSMPRDSYVTIPGFGQHKLNSAYARGKLAAKKDLQAQGVTDEKELELRSNQEGAKTLIATIEALTGQTIDNYASINLLGFYDITNAIGGVDVCLKQDTNDPYSGANFKAGRQTISGVDALAFVRQRHGLLRGDLDRVVRQQVFLAGLANKVLSAGTLADPAKLNNLVEAIQKSVVVNKGWDILSFAQQLKGLTGGQIQFRTIPIVNPEYDTPDGMAVQVDPAEVRQFVGKLSGKKVTKPPAPSPAEITVDVYNTSNVQGLAGTVSEALVAQGFMQGEIANDEPRQASVVQAATGERASAQAVADALGGGLAVEESAEITSGHVRVLLAPDYDPSGASAAGGPAGGGNAPGAKAPSQAGKGAAEEPITADGVTCVN
ncbi:LCP family protein [Saccharomonospora xinjiangensis]|uniref:Cell envelope-related function transcriptional attenuator common domain n=1 Tax=Saccharomonospora xinjiangensis XJ-54 TaxID=882086 RepID=I0V5S7_9PSEU|nr:LCP family protein [Saccharomonospora xinjiangensis]EID55480.1 cell envelope-related function transcriptional attenuator common domain [Saccharomonospora xinjiangensis XJ-54]